MAKGCSASSGGPYPSHAKRGRITAYPTEVRKEGHLGLRPLAVDDERVGIVYIPRSYQPGFPAPLALMLHGAGGNAQQGIGLLINLADDTGMILVALDAVESTWDVIATEYGPDVHRVDRALHQIFAHYNVSRKHVAIGGFSDGASYALSLGLGNGDMFTHIIAFSPGFIAPAEEIGRPAVFVSHGTHDRVLPIDRTSRLIVPSLRESGYLVEYVEFDGPHTVPPAIAVAAVGWFLPEELTLPRSVA